MWVIPTSSTFSYIKAQQCITGNPNLTFASKFLASLLTTLAIILHLIITYNLLSRPSHHDDVTYMDVYRIDQIL